MTGVTAVQTQTSDEAAPVPPARTRVRIAHALFTYHEVGRQRVAYRDDEVVLDDAECQRGRASGAFAPTGEEPLLEGPLPPFPNDGSDVDRQVWIRSAGEAEVLAWGDLHPEHRWLLMVTEQGRGPSMRQGLVDELEHQVFHPSYEELFAKAIGDLRAVGGA